MSEQDNPSLLKKDEDTVVPPTRCRNNPGKTKPAMMLFLRRVV